MNKQEVSSAVNVPHSTVSRVLRNKESRLYHAQKVQALVLTGYAPRVEFTRWFLQQLAVQLDFRTHVLFAAECTFTREGIYNTHNSHMWALRNLQDTQPHAYQKRLNV